MSFSDLDAAIEEVLRSDERQRCYRSSFARRWQMRIDRTPDFCRKHADLTHPYGLLAAAAVALYEAEAEVDEWAKGQKLDEARVLIAQARQER